MKTTGFQTLFDDLPASLLKDAYIEEQPISTEVLDRVTARSKAKCDVSSAASRRSLRRIWLIPAVAILLVAAMVSGLALSSYVFAPTYGYPTPVIASQNIKPLVEHYDNAVSINAAVEHDGLRVTVNKYVVDTEDGTLRLLLSVESANGKPLTEPLTAERMSLITRTTFRRIELTCYGDADEELVIDREHIYNLHGDGGYLQRTDGATDPYTASFQLTYKLLGGDGADFLNKHFVLSLTDYRDTVRVMNDIGFTFENMQSLYDRMTPADTSDFVCGAADNGYADGRVEYDHLLPDSGQKIRFSAVSDAYIDNIGFCANEFQDGKEQLYISFAGLKDGDGLPAFIDTRNGGEYIGSRQEPLDDAADRDRVTLHYNVTKDMLPYLFMMAHGGYETVKRAEGTWDVPFTVGEMSVPVYTYEIDADVTFHEYALHLTKLTLTDSSLWFDAAFVITPSPKGETTYGDIYGTIDLVLADGTVLKNPFYQGPNSDIWKTGKRTGACRWGGELEGFIDAEQIVAVIALGERIELHK